MRRRVVVSPEAETDLDELASFIAEDSFDAAVHLYEAVANAYRRLLSMPEIGAKRESVTPRVKGLRMWPIPEFANVLVFYRPIPIGIEIVRVLHAARDLPGVLEAE